MERRSTMQTERTTEHVEILRLLPLADIKMGVSAVSKETRTIGVSWASLGDTCANGPIVCSSAWPKRKEAVKVRVSRRLCFKSIRSQFFFKDFPWKTAFLMLYLWEEPEKASCYLNTVVTSRFGCFDWVHRQILEQLFNLYKLSYSDFRLSFAGKSYEPQKMKIALLLTKMDIISMSFPKDFLTGNDSYRLTRFTVAGLHQHLFHS